MKRHTTNTKFLRALIAADYLLMYLWAVGIMYLWYYGWQELEALETENRRISAFRQEVHHIYGRNDWAFPLFALLVLRKSSQRVKKAEIFKRLLGGLKIICTFAHEELFDSNERQNAEIKTVAKSLPQILNIPITLSF